MAGIQKILIDQQLAQLGIRQIHSKLHIKSPKMQMRIHNEIPQMEIERVAPSFKVNRKKINSESGLKSPGELARAFRDQGRSSALKGMRTAVADGNFLGDLRRGGDKVGKLAKSKTMNRILSKKEINIVLMPKSKAEITWDKGSMKINWSKQSLVIDWDGEYMPMFTVDPKHSMEVYFRTEPYFRVTVQDMIDPGSPGKYVDKAI